MKIISTTLTISAITATVALGQQAFAGNPVSDAAMQHSLSQLSRNVSKSNDLLNQSNNILQDIDAAIPAGAFSISKSFSSYFGGADPLFPNISIDPKSNLNGSEQAHDWTTNWTQASVDQQLHSMSAKLAPSYSTLSQNTQFMPEPMRDDMLAALTCDKPSYDTLFLPGSDEQKICRNFKEDGSAAHNASSLSFNTLFAPLTYNSKTQKTDDQFAAASNYITYALETYQPMITSNDSNSSAGGEQNESFFSKLNDMLSDNPKQAPQILKKVLTDPRFQRYWLTLRTLEAKNSLILSNFNSLVAERKSQTGLGQAYGIPNKPNASALEVESHMVNNTVNNPKWYQHMKTATPSTLQREQLLMTALQVKLQYENKMLSERNLATLTMLTHSMLQNSKQALSAQEMQLKSLLSDISGTSDSDDNSTSSASSGTNSKDASKYNANPYKNNKQAK